MMRGERVTYAHIDEHHRQTTSHHHHHHHHHPQQQQPQPPQQNLHHQEEFQPIASVEGMNIVQLHNKFQSELENRMNLQPLTQYYLLDDLQSQKQSSLNRQQTFDSFSSISSTSNSSPEIRQGLNMNRSNFSNVPTPPSQQPQQQQQHHHHHPLPSNTLTRSISGPIRKYHGNSKFEGDWPNSPSFPNYVTESNPSSSIVRNSMNTTIGNLTGNPTVNPMWCEQQQQQQQQQSSSPNFFQNSSTNFELLNQFGNQNPISDDQRSLTGPLGIQNFTTPQTQQKWPSIEQLQFQHQQQIQQQQQQQQRHINHRRTVSSSEHLMRSFPFEFQPSSTANTINPSVEITPSSNFSQFSTSSIINPSNSPSFTSTTTISNISSSRPTLSRTRSHRSEIDREEANRQKSKRHYDRKKDQRTALADLTAHLVHVAEQLQNIDLPSCQSETFKELLNALQFRLPLPVELGQEKDGKLLGNPIKRANERKRLNKLMQRHLEMQRIQQLSFAARALEPSLHLSNVINLINSKTISNENLSNVDAGETKAIVTLLQAWIRCRHAWPHLLLAEERLSLIAGRPLARMITSLRSVTNVE